MSTEVVPDPHSAGEAGGPDLRKAASQILEAAKQLQSLRLEANRYLLLRHLLAKAVTEPSALAEVLGELLDYSLEFGTLAETGAVFLVTHEAHPRAADFLFKRVWTPEDELFKTDQPKEFSHFEEGSGLIGTVLSTGRVRWSNDPTNESDYEPFAKTAHQLRSVVCVPVMFGEAMLAVMSVHNRHSGARFEEADVAFLEGLAHVAAIVIRANHNWLTLLPNRELMYHLIAQELLLAEAAGAPLSLAYVDVDHFADLNGKVGHANADHAVRIFAKFLREEAGTRCIVGHPHGDEFLVLFPGRTTEEAKSELEVLIEKLRSSMFPIEYRHGTYEWHPSATAGLVEARPGVNIDDLVGVADELNHKAKKEDRRGSVQT